MSNTSQRQASSAAAEGPVLSIVYASAATVPFSELDLAVLLAASRLANEVHKLTGLLLYRNGQFMQALEGPERAVRQTLAKIGADSRHTGVWILTESMLTSRQFGSWAMGYNALSDQDLATAPRWFGSPEALEQRDDTRAGELLAWFHSR